MQLRDYWQYAFYFYREYRSFKRKRIFDKLREINDFVIFKMWTKFCPASWCTTTILAPFQLESFGEWDGFSREFLAGGYTENFVHRFILDRTFVDFTVSLLILSFYIVDFNSKMVKPTVKP
jgi:hypothetical protein